MKAALFSLVAVLAISCNSKNRDVNEAKNVAVANAMFDSFNNHQWEAMAGYYAEPASFLDPSFGSAYVSGKASDSLSFTLPIITVLTIKDGLIVKDATYYDNQN